MSNTHASDDRRLVRYLMGSLPADETERLDELSITDDQFVAQLGAVENDLVDAYVNGELSGDALERFRTHYLSSPAARDKVTFAEALLKYQRGTATAPARAAPGRLRLAVPRLVPQWGWAVAALLFLGAASYLLVDNNRLRRQLHDAGVVRVASEARERQPQPQVSAQQSASVEAAKEPVREAPATTVIASFVLLPPRRGTGDIATIAIPPGTRTVTLLVDLESDDFPVYRAELKDPGTGQIIWRGANLRGAPRDGARSLSITFAASRLKPRTYTVDVTGVPARGAPESVGSYPFRVAPRVPE